MMKTINEREQAASINDKICREKCKANDSREDLMLNAQTTLRTGRSLNKCSRLTKNRHVCRSLSRQHLNLIGRTQ